MANSINFSGIKQSITNNVQSAAGWLGKHKVTIAGAALTAVTVAAVIATSILTCGTIAIICGAVLGGVALTSGLGTTVLAVKHHITEKKAEERKCLQAAIDNSYERGRSDSIMLKFAALLTGLTIIMAYNWQRQLVSVLQ
jgi:hypothetical protein